MPPIDHDRCIADGRQSKHRVLASMIVNESMLSVPRIDHDACIVGDQAGLSFLKEAAAGGRLKNPCSIPCRETIHSHNSRCQTRFVPSNIDDFRDTERPAVPCSRGRLGAICSTMDGRVWDVLLAGRLPKRTTQRIRQLTDDSRTHRSLLVMIADESLLSVPLIDRDVVHRGRPAWVVILEGGRRRRADLNASVLHIPCRETIHAHNSRGPDSLRSFD